MATFNRFGINFMVSDDIPEGEAVLGPTDILAIPPSRRAVRLNRETVKIVNIGEKADGEGE